MQTDIFVPASRFGQFGLAQKLTAFGRPCGWQVVSGTQHGGARVHYEAQGGDKALRLCRAIAARLNARTGKHAYANTGHVQPQPQDYVAAGIQRG